MPIEHIPSESYRQKRGHIFDTAITDRVNDVAEYQINAIREQLETKGRKSKKNNDSVEKPDHFESDENGNAINIEAVRKINEDRLAAYYRYISEINPKTSYNAGRISPKSFKARKLTIEKLDDYLKALGWTPKYFLEVILEENNGFTPEQCSKLEKPDNWSEVVWPNAAMQDMAEVLKNTEGKAKDKIESVIMGFLPESYNALLAELNSANTELGWNDEKLPGYVQDNIDEYSPETKIENMADRIYTSIRYKYNDEALVQSMISEAGISANAKRIFHPRHYWVFNPKEINKICKAFSLTPHWVFYGADPTPLLCDNIRDEVIMDKFQFLPEQTQYMLAKAFKSAIES